MAFCKLVRASLRAMASCKLFGGSAFCARGRGFSTEPPPFTKTLGGSAGEVLDTLRPHVRESGQHLLSILGSLLLEQKVYLEQQKVYLEQQKVHLEEKAVLLQATLKGEQELRARTQIDFLRAQGLNNTRGLFELLQDFLAAKSNITSRLRGVALWEAILMAHPDLAACIYKCTRIPASDVARQALHCYNVFSILSQHIHDGKNLAQLQAGQGGTIEFERGPLSTEQVQVLLCIGAAAQVSIAENTASRTMTL